MNFSAFSNRSLNYVGTRQVGAVFWVVGLFRREWIHFGGIPICFNCKFRSPKLPLLTANILCWALLRFINGTAVWRCLRSFQSNIFLFMIDTLGNSYSYVSESWGSCVKIETLSFCPELPSLNKIYPQIPKTKSSSCAIFGQFDLQYWPE